MSELSNVAGAGQSVPAEFREEVLSATTINTGGGGGFGFENHHRNARITTELAKSGKEGTLPRAKLTGTTICGCIYKGGVVLGADTRATGGTEVVDKNCEKIHYLAPNIYCCGAGTAADTEKTTEMISGQVGLVCSCIIRVCVWVSRERRRQTDGNKDRQEKMAHTSLSLEVVLRHNAKNSGIRAPCWSLLEHGCPAVESCPFQSLGVLACLYFVFVVQEQTRPIVRTYQRHSRRDGASVSEGLI